MESESDARGREGLGGRSSIPRGRGRKGNALARRTREVPSCRVLTASCLSSSHLLQIFLSAPFPASERSRMAPIRVAAIQASPIAYDLPATLAKLRTLVSSAANDGAKLVVLPEAFLSAYPRNLGFRVGSRTDEDREWFGKYVEVSRNCGEGRRRWC